MTETGAGIKEPTRSLEKAGRLEEDKRLAGQVESLINKGNTSLYCRGGWLGSKA